MKPQGYEQAIVFDFETAAEPWPNIDDPVVGGRILTDQQEGPFPLEIDWIKSLPRVTS